MFDALLWDNDGVLVDTEGLYFQATSEALARVGVTLTEADYRQLFLVEARGAWHLAAERGVDEATIAALKEMRSGRYLELIDAHPLVLPGVSEALTALGARHRMAIVTSSEPHHFARIHQRTGLLPHFELVLTRSDYEHSKPHPEPYLRAVAALGVPPARCLVIEDSERGLHAAKAAGLACWVVPSALTRPFSFARADRVLGTISDVARALL